MTDRTVILTKLKRLSESQFDKVVFYVTMPFGHFASSYILTQKTIALTNYAEPPSKLDKLGRIIEDVRAVSRAPNSFLYDSKHLLKLTMLQLIGRELRGLTHSAKPRLGCF